MGEAVAAGNDAIGFTLAWVMYIRRPTLPGQFATEHDLIYKFLLNKWYIDEIYNFIFVRPVKWLARLFWKVATAW